MQRHGLKKRAARNPAARIHSLILAGRAAIAAPGIAAILADELQAVEMAVVTAANGTFEFHGRKSLKWLINMMI